MFITAQTLVAAFKLTDQYTATMQKIIQSSDAYEKKQQEAQRVTEQFKSSVKGIGNSSNSATTGLGMLITKMGGIVTAAYLGKKAIDLMFSAIKLGATEQVQLNSFKSLLGSDSAGAALNDYIKAYASKSALGFKDLASATTSWLAFTHDTNQIEQLNKLVERLYAKDPNQGAEGAVFALKEVLAGQTMSLKDRFNMNGISAEKVAKLTNAGDIAGTISYIDTVFNRFGATQGIVTANFDSLTMGFNRFKTNFMQGMTDEASPTVQNLSLVMKNLNADMDAGKFQPFFSLMANGAAAIGNGIAWVTQNMNVVAPVVVGVVMAIIAYNAAMAIATGVTMVFGAAAGAVTGQWLLVAAAVATVAATAATVSGITNSLKSGSNADVTKSLADAKAAAAKAMSGVGVSAVAKVPVEVSNKSPISVKGTVEIEKENQKYWFDLAAQKAIATFSMMQVTPQVNIQNQNISKETDANEVINIISNAVSSATGTQAQGVYQ